MDKEKFEKLVEEAISQIPHRLKKHIANVVVQVEEKASQEIQRQTGSSPFSTLLGLYHGVPFKHRGPYYGNLPPDVIVIYQESIERLCSNEEEVKLKVREVILHEIGHYFGMTEDDLRKIESEK